MSSDRIMAEEPIEKKITRILIHRKMTVTAAESCTGGLVAGTLVNADGISEVFKESYVTYSNEAKHKLLGVKKETLEKYGAVSRQTAAEMAEGAVRAAGADASVGRKRNGLVRCCCIALDHSSSSIPRPGRKNCEEAARRLLAAWKINQWKMRGDTT